MHATTDRLHDEVDAIVRRLGLGNELVAVAVDAADDGEMPFLRISVKLKSPGTVATDSLIALQEAVEERLATIDERFVSVRFPEHA